MTDKNKTIRAVVVDDSPTARDLVVALLNAEQGIEVVGTGASGEDAIRLVKRHKPDVLAMDIRMKGMDGLEATRQLVGLLPNTKILIITMYEDNELVRACIRAGAAGYIIKRASESELVDAIYAIRRGIIYIHPTLIPSVISPAPLVEEQSSAEIDSLSNREVEVLSLIQKGYTNVQIGEKLNISVRTVETHRSNLMGKLGLHGRAELVRYATRHGLG